MSEGVINGPIKIEVEVLGSHSTERLALLLATMEKVVRSTLGSQTECEVGCDWGKN